jgi:hypothetical protein
MFQRNVAEGSVSQLEAPHESVELLIVQIRHGPE